MLVLHDPETLTHDTVELLGSRLIPSLESPARILAILEALKNSKHTVHVITGGEHDPGFTEVLRETHDLQYLDHLRHSHAEWVAAGHITKTESILPECFPTFSIPRSSTANQAYNATLQPPKDVFARSGYFAFDMSSAIMSDTYHAALCSAHLASHATSLIMSTSEATIMALCRPPGHHCDTTKAGGYCYLNNCVVVVQSFIAIRRQSGDEISDDKIVVLDLDFHHGNGTQSFFYDRQVRYISLHGKDEYPYYTGSSAERGSGVGLGYNHNFPLPQKCSIEEYLETLDRALALGSASKPVFLVLSLGFDTFVSDPLGSFDLQTVDYFVIARHICSSVQDLQMKTVILLEGGYVIEDLGQNLVAFLDGWQASAGGQNRPCMSS